MKIGICGKMCSGKTTIANLIYMIDNRYEKYSFASKIKELARELFNMNGKDRDLLINIGTKFREIDPDVWVNHVLKKTKYKKHCIIDDVRFQNEVDLLIKNGWKIIQLNISEENQIQRLQKTYPNDYKEHLKNRDHISEQNNLKFCPILTINTDIDIQKIKHEIYLLLNSKL